MARDVSNAALYSNATLLVSVLAGLPSSPRFTNTSITLSVLENATLGAAIGSLGGLVVDGSGRTLSASFSLVGGFLNNSYTQLLNFTGPSCGFMKQSYVKEVLQQHSANV